MIRGGGGSKSRLAKAAGAESARQMKDEKLHIWKSKCAKHFSLGPLLEVAKSKKFTRLWREAHVEAKSVKNCGC